MVLGVLKSPPPLPKTACIRQEVERTLKYGREIPLTLHKKAQAIRLSEFDEEEMAFNAAIDAPLAERASWKPHAQVGLDDGESDSAASRNILQDRQRSTSDVAK